MKLYPKVQPEYPDIQPVKLTSMRQLLDLVSPNKPLVENVIYVYERSYPHMTFGNKHNHITINLFK